MATPLHICISNSNNRIIMTVDPVNKITLDVIERAQFVLCLDPAHPGMEIKSSVTAEQLGIMSNSGLHGNGSKYYSCNRWFDHAIEVHRTGAICYK